MVNVGIRSCFWERNSLLVSGRYYNGFINEDIIHMFDCGCYERLYCGCISFIDEELSAMDKDERMKLYGSYGWMFSSGCETPTLEPLIVGNEPRVNTFREKLREWFMVVCNYSFSPYHFGKTSYSHFMNATYWQGTKAKGNKVYPQRVILLLGMTGIFTGVKTNYLHVNDKTRDHGREYYVDIDKLKEWTSTSTEPADNFSETCSSMNDDVWVQSASADSDDFDYSFVEKNDDASRQSWSLYDDWFSYRQYETISSISVIPECYVRACQFISTCTYKMLDAVKVKDKKKDLRGRYRNCQWIINLHNGDVGCCKVDDKGGRYYTMMVCMGKDYRRACLQMDGERIVEVDVSSSQPTLIGLKIKKDTGKTTEWLKHCLLGDFYEWVKDLTGVKVERAKVKTYIMRYLFSCYGSGLPQNFQGEHLPPDNKVHKRGYKKFEQKLTAYIKDNEPEIYDLIERHKRNPVWTDKTWTDQWKTTRKGKWCSTLPVLMQKTEVEFIKTCLARLPKEMKFYTIHDAICVKESNGEIVKAVMGKVSQEMYGERISIKIENSSQDNVK